MAQFVEQTTGSITWHVLPDWQSTLLGPTGLPMDRWRDEGQLRVVARGRHRTIYRVEHAERRFFVKHFHPAGLRGMLRSVLRRSPARCQWRQTVEVARRGIPTVRPVAWAERTVAGVVCESFLVTEAVEAASPLDEFVLATLPLLPPQRQPSVMRRTVEGLARIVAAMHEAGVCHRDFHAGNVLVRLSDGPSADVEMTLIDLPNVRFSGALKWSSALGNLATFNANGFKRSSRAQRWRFWTTYLSARPGLDLPDSRKAAGQLEQAAAVYSRRVDRRRDGRSLCNNRDFRAMRTENGSAYGVVDLAAEDLRRALAQPAALLLQNHDRPVKIGHRSLIVEAELPLAGGPAAVAYKRYRLRNVWKGLCAWFRPSPARRDWLLGHALLARGIATPRPLMVCQPRAATWRRESYLATQWMAGAENLHLWAWRIAEQPLPCRLRMAADCAERLGRLIGKMHAMQISHRDLKAANLLVGRCDGRWQTHLVDLDGMRIHRRMRSTRRAANLARLATGLEAHRWITPAVCCRFLRAYVRQFPPGAVSWKPLWRDVARRTDRIIRRKHRRGDPVL